MTLYSLRPGSHRKTQLLPVLLAILAGCHRAPARLVAGISDTVVINNVRPVQLPVQVLDVAGRQLEGIKEVRFHWMSGTPLSVSSAGVATCSRPGDAVVLASLGSLATHVVIRCRPVGEVRAVRMVNAIAGGPAQELPFEAVDPHGQPVTILAASVTVGDSTIASVDRLRVLGRSPGSTDLNMRAGDRVAHAAVHVYERALSPEGIRPGQHLAVPLHLNGGEVRRWRLAASQELYFLTMLSDGDELNMPQLAIVGAACERGLDAHSYFCLARRDAFVFVYEPYSQRSKRVISGTLAVWRQSNP